MMNDLFKFIGSEPKPDDHWQTRYETGRVYLLFLSGCGAFGAVGITQPLAREYTTWNAFLEDWKRV